MQEFSSRHIGPRDSDIQSMLKVLGFSSLEDLAGQVIPKSIRSETPSQLEDGVSEHDLLKDLKVMMKKNKVFTSMIGLGYANTITPTVIQRNVFENPVWYTAYTPYQAEIAQGRLEALLNFQTMVMDLTAMEVSNASLLDEGTAAAEAMAMAVSLQKGDRKKFLVSPTLHPHVLEVLETRALPLGLEMVVASPEKMTSFEDYFAVFVQYPNTFGNVEDHRDLAEKIHGTGGFLIVGTDLLSLTLLTPPGEWGADMVYGNSQRFGVPLGFGGPHAAFLATKDAFKRNLPGRLVGVSVDSHGKRALRLALQTREQHIRREKATSNICTAQVLLANMASMYAVYHGPEGLRRIAANTHSLAAACAENLKQMSVSLKSPAFFDTLHVQVPDADKIIQAAVKREYNLRKVSSTELTLSFDETSSWATVEDVLSIFAEGLGTEKVSALPTDSALRFFPSALTRKSKYLTHPVFNTHQSETQMLRYIHSLQNKDLTLTHSMIPLGSCTMKLNATTELVPVSWPEVNQIHPFAPISQTQGYMELIKDLEEKLCQITGFAGVALQPNAGSQGEYAGLLVIRKYFESRNESHRNICLIPSSAHGTNPASAVMAGMKVVVVACDEQGNVDIPDLKRKADLHKNTLAALMITYPSTHGVFEEGIRDICSTIHQCGGQVYMDGANMNALVEVCRPGEFGPDVSHMNLHKTFAIPHGGGGPGIGPIGVGEHLKPFLPRHRMVPESGPAQGITSTTSAPWGSASILPISWTYITLMGGEGLKKATLVSILSANYIAKKLEEHYPILYKGREGLVAHECILDLRHLKKSSGVDVTDVAKRLIDYGFHAPTMSWPVAGTLMVEPTESEDLAEMDRFINAMIAIRKEIGLIEKKTWNAEDNPLRNAPHTVESVTANSWDHPYSREEAAYPIAYLKQNKFWPSVGRIDNAYGDKNFVCSCPPLEDYEDSAAN